MPLGPEVATDALDRFAVQHAGRPAPQRIQMLDGPGPSLAEIVAAHFVELIVDVAAGQQQRTHGDDDARGALGTCNDAGPRLGVTFLAIVGFAFEAPGDGVELDAVGGPLLVL